MPDRLEILSRLPQRRSKPNLLFVHGAYAGAWCWDVNFLPYFASRGYPSHALSLSGHGASAGAGELHQFRIANYVQDLAETVERLGQDTVLIGHSMGGFVVQKYLETRIARGAVLLASVPPEGLTLSALRLAFADPLLYQQIMVVQNFGEWSSAPDVLRRALFSDDAEHHMIEPYFSRFQAESQRAILDMTWLDLPLCSRIKGTPMLVAGARRDAFFPPDMATRTAEAYGVQPLLLDDLAHAVMLEPRWQRAADSILDWLKSVGA
ncbi:MAG: alpha/beta fold hydrolase [Alphaproteobacteria bacterium]|nr:alpha/beta fold hydrolase [Alphaproteobacteria bacterium]